MALFDPAVTQTLVHEGGDTVTNDPVDKGGMTKYGISQRTYPELDIRNLTEDKAKIIYREDYWDEVNGDRILIQEMAESIFDTAVNMGVRAASRLAQSALGFKYQDGIIGPKTLEALNQADENIFLYRFALVKIAYYMDIYKNNSSQRRFLFGWINRAIKGFA